MNDVIPAFCQDAVIAVAGVNDVITVADRDDILATTCEDDIVSGTCRYCVISIAGCDQVIAVTCRNFVITVVAEDFIIACAGKNAIVSWSAFDVVVAVCADEHIVAFLAIEFVVSGAAVQQVISFATVNLIVAVITISLGISGAGKIQLIAAGTPMDVHVCGDRGGDIDKVFSVAGIRHADSGNPGVPLFDSHGIDDDFVVGVTFGDGVRFIDDVFKVFTSQVSIRPDIQQQGTAILTSNFRSWSPAPADAATDCESEDRDFEFCRCTGLRNLEVCSQRCQGELDLEESKVHREVHTAVDPALEGVI